MPKTRKELDRDIEAFLGPATAPQSSPMTCDNCGGGLDGSDLSYGLVCPPCGVRVAGPFVDAHDVPDYKPYEPAATSRRSARTHSARRSRP